MMIAVSGPWPRVHGAHAGAAVVPDEPHSVTVRAKPSNDNCDELAPFIDVILGTSGGEAVSDRDENN